MVNTVVTAAPEGVRVAGLKEQVAPAGSPEHAKLIAELKPYSGVAVSVMVPWVPALSVTDPGVACKVNVDGGVMVYVAEPTALLE